MIPVRRAALAAALCFASAGGTALAQSCDNGAGFARWLQGVKQEAAAAGISRGTIDRALNGVSYDPNTVARDRRQSVFSQSFLEFAGRMVSSYRLQHGAANMQKYASTFRATEQRFGVPAPVITAFWALETDFGANLGDFNTIRALATLAYDCRRPDFFRPHLLDALRLLDRGDLTLDQMRGAWAGEVGHIQFLPSDYYHNAVDADGDGRRNLVTSVPDVIASAGSLLASHGWQRGPWLEEVRVPAELPWQEADLAIKHPRGQWANWGVTRPNGEPLPSDGVPATLLLPMGRLGPAFLAYQNFDVYLQWNQSLVYATTAAYLATRLAGAPRVNPGRGQPPEWSFDGLKALQRLLVAQGYDVGGVDGFLGAKTRAAVKAVQLKLGLPADSYPTPELMRRLGG